AIGLRSSEIVVVGSTKIFDSDSCEEIGVAFRLGRRRSCQNQARDQYCEQVAPSHQVDVHPDQIPFEKKRLKIEADTRLESLGEIRSESNQPQTSRQIVIIVADFNIRGGRKFT